MDNLHEIFDKKIIALFSAGGFIQGIGSAVAKYKPTLEVIFILAQIAVAVLTALLLIKKLRKK